MITYILMSIIVYQSVMIVKFDFPFWYNTIPLTISAISLFMFFKELRIKNEKIKNVILKIAPLTFAVYLLHEHPLVRERLYKFIVNTCAKYNCNDFLMLFGFAIAIYIVACVIEAIRRKILYSIENKFLKNDTQFK